MLNWIPGLELGIRAVRSIRRNGLKSFIQNSVVFRLRLYMCKMKLFISCGIDIYLPFDTQWPDKNLFLPLKPVSSSGRQGKPSVCLVTYNMSAGGAERQVAGLACALKKLGYDVRVRVLRLDGESGHYLPYLRAHGVDISVPKMPSFSDIKFMKQQGVDISLIKHLPAEIRIDAIALTAEMLRRPVDVVHCYLDGCCCYGGFAALLSGIPMIRLSWRNAKPTNFGFFADWMPHLYKFLLQFSHIKVECNSFAGALDYTKWLGLPSEKVEVMPNGVDPVWFYSSNEKSGAALRETIGVAPGAPLVVSVGRLVPQKRHLDLPDILLALREKIPLASLVHIGDGPLKDDLQTRITAAGLDGSSGNNWTDKAIILLGRRRNVFDYLLCSEVFLLTSSHEGMPNVVMEAMLAGLPVVATRAGGVPDLVEDGVHGYLHDVGDITGMARSLERLLKDPVLRKRMGNAGRERILSGFTVHNLTDRLTRAYAAQCSAGRQ
ncbi:MAG: glycosyltransferase [Deltaproteobacteria bacterium]|nr:glycosyltransferase [Deltaproteobacteria bacterium]